MFVEYNIFDDITDPDKCIIVSVTGYVWVMYVVVDMYVVFSTF